MPQPFKSLRCLGRRSIIPLRQYWLHQVSPMNEWNNLPLCIHFPFLMVQTQRLTLAQGNEAKQDSVCADSCSTDGVHRPPGWQEPHPHPLSTSTLVWAQPAAQSISIGIWAAVTLVTNFGMQCSPLIDKETEINSQFGLGMRLEWIKENSFYSSLFIPCEEHWQPVRCRCESCIWLTLAKAGRLLRLLLCDLKLCCIWSKESVHLISSDSFREPSKRM